MLRVLLFVFLFSLVFAKQADMTINLDSFKTFAIRQGVSATTCYGVMLDCGSSSTKVNVFSWPCRQIQQMPNIDIRQEAPSVRLSPGISAFSTNVSGVGPYLRACLNFADTIVPSAQRSQTPVFLRATAGMRLLPQASQDAILQEARNFLQTTSYLSSFANWTRVISGQEEGVFAFLALNFLLNKLASNVPASQTVAAIDLGGASTQLSFFTPNNLPSNVQYTVQLQGVQSYPTYTYSFLGYGNDQARLAAQQASPMSGNTVTFPCFHSGYTIAASYNSSLTLVGSSNIAACRQVIRQIMKFEMCGSQTDCSIGGVFMPLIPDNMQVYAFSAVATAGTFFNSTGQVTVAAFRSRVEAFCNRTWADVTANFRVDGFLPNNCFLGMYTVELLSAGYRLGESRSIQVQTSVNGISLSWALGATLFDVSTVPCRRGTEACVAGSSAMIAASPLLLLVVLFLSLLLA